MIKQTAGPDPARQEVDAILSSGIFSASSRQAKLLEYLYMKTARGQAEALKEYTIAVELFQKPANFDQHADATVRVEAHRLRKKLQSYYETLGRDHELRVRLTAGQYRLDFENTRTDASGEAQVNGSTPGRRPAPIRRSLVASLAAVAIAVTAVSGWLYHDLGTRAKPVRALPAAVPLPRDAAPDPEPGAIRFLVAHSGPPFVDSSGRSWQADRYYDGGEIRTVMHPVRRTGRPQLFRRVREGTFRYRIPLPAREYELRLYLTDPDDPDHERPPDRRFRIMTVNANGRDIMPPYDLDIEAGQNADIQSFAPVRPRADGILELLFWSARGPAAVCAIELLPLIEGRIRPIRISARHQPYEDNQGRLWLPDDYYSGGKLGGYQAMISGGGDPGIYSGERIGDFEYFIPVPPGEYEVRLYFAEGWFGTGENGGSAGTRIFDVLLNHEFVLREFDMLGEAPPRQLIARSFKHVAPDRYGKIHLTFAARTNYASLRAIELLPEK